MRNKVNSLLKRGIKVVGDGMLLNIIQSELRHEISNPRFLGVETGKLGAFKLDCDSPGNRDIVLRRQFNSGEEVVVSALLQQEPIDDADDDDIAFPRGAVAKVCISKPRLSSILQFDCRVSETARGSSDFDIERAYYIRSLCSSSSPYGGNFFRELDPRLQDALKQYLTSKGISEGLTNFILCHLNKKEQEQYVSWLRKLESTVTHSLKP
ncbi:Mitochondrial glycoprotein family protein [Raphanus sativus]|uniref:Uncharacterized protein At2g39795, mitochondrial n=1 Tax=Raphanus sativus TaxID=3726 RepID=A0A6J0M004_RAPSA|nr:uncharacterized protein At2g39795, mitochondrial [Raphanus sativus]KAJ4904051.1 Mitochondrial glycoprotein family protein [Raphanus sativus]